MSIGSDSNRPDPPIHTHNHDRNHTQLTDRAFQLTVGHQRLPRFEAAFDAPFVNWSRPLDPKEYTEHLYAAHKVRAWSPRCIR
jgi:hypothetical protein